MRRLLAISLLALPVPAFADGPAGPKTIECYCTDRTGSRVEMGETICLEVNGRRFMAQCQMSLNVPMWRELQEGCATSDATPLMNTPERPYHS